MVQGCAHKKFSSCKPHLKSLLMFLYILSKFCGYVVSDQKIPQKENVAVSETINLQDLVMDPFHEDQVPPNDAR